MTKSDNVTENENCSCAKQRVSHVSGEFEFEVTCLYTSIYNRKNYEVKFDERQNSTDQRKSTC